MAHEPSDVVLGLKMLFDELCIHLASKDLLTQHEYDGLFASSLLKLQGIESPNAEGAIKFIREVSPLSAKLRDEPITH